MCYALNCEHIVAWAIGATRFACDLSYDLYGSRAQRAVLTLVINRAPDSRPTRPCPKIFTTIHRKENDPGKKNRALYRTCWTLRFSSEMSDHLIIRSISERRTKHKCRVDCTSILFELLLLLSRHTKSINYILRVKRQYRFEFQLVYLKKMFWSKSQY